MYLQSYVTCVILLGRKTHKSKLKRPLGKQTLFFVHVSLCPDTPDVESKLIRPSQRNF